MRLSRPVIVVVTGLEFATEMIQHHAQAMEMVDLTMDRDLDPDVASLAEDIRATEAPEIEKLVGFLDEWDHQPILERAEGASFEAMWLAEKMKHHEGAIAMAEDEQKHGEDEEALALAERIADEQAREIGVLRRLLGQ